MYTRNRKEWEGAQRTNQQHRTVVRRERNNRKTKKEQVTVKLKENDVNRNERASIENRRHSKTRELELEAETKDMEEVDGRQGIRKVRSNGVAGGMKKRSFVTLKEK